MTTRPTPARLPVCEPPHGVATRLWDIAETGRDVDGDGVGLEARHDSGGTPSGSTAELRLQLLGGFSVRVGGRDIDDSDWYLREAKNVIKFLALEPGRRARRTRLLEVLWPECGKAARSDLNKALCIAAHVLEPDLPSAAASSYVHTQGDVVLLAEGAPVWIDADVFERAALTAKRSREPERYEHALRLYTGDLLPGDSCAEWAMARRKRLKDMYLDLLLDIATMQAQGGDIVAAIATLRRLVVMDPAREETQALLARLSSSET